MAGQIEWSARKTVIKRAIKGTSISGCYHLGRRLIFEGTLTARRES
jgi:hypothetical protein